MRDAFGPELPPPFDWCNDDSVIVPGQLAVAAYFNTTGDLILRREAAPYCDDADAVIVIGRVHVPVFAAAMAALVDRVDNVISKPAPLSNAERQRRYRLKRNEDRTAPLRVVTSPVTPDDEVHNLPPARGSHPDMFSENKTRPAGEAERAFDFGGTRPAQDG
jgi:hypothetical protein